MFYGCFHHSNFPQPKKVLTSHTVWASSMSLVHPYFPPYSSWYHFDQINIKKPFFSCTRTPFFVNISTIFQEGGSILDLFPLFMSSLRWNRKRHHFFLILLTPITFDFNKISCYGGYYYVTIAVVSYQLKTSKFVRLSMPESLKIIQSSLTHLRVCSPFKTVIYCYQPPPRDL